MTIRSPEPSVAQKPEGSAVVVKTGLSIDEKGWGIYEFRNQRHFIIQMLLSPRMDETMLLPLTSFTKKI